MPELRIGCSGFSYPDWRGVFYPRDLPQKRWLEHYAGVFDTVELNVTFYRLPLVKSFERWHEETPPDFAFSLKGSRFITHVKRLLDPEEPLKAFFERASGLKEKLRAVLWQLSPAFRADLPRLERFLRSLSPYPVHHAFEFRHESWITEKTISLVREHGASLCTADWPEFINDLPVTSDLVYIRRHGEGGSYATSYSRDELKRDAKRIREYLKGGGDVFIYFNNDYQGYAPQNACELKGLLE